MRWLGSGRCTESAFPELKSNGQLRSGRRRDHASTRGFRGCRPHHHRPSHRLAQQMEPRITPYPMGVSACPLSLSQFPSWNIAYSHSANSLMVLAALISLMNALTKSGAHIDNVGHLQVNGRRPLHASTAARTVSHVLEDASIPLTLVHCPAIAQHAYAHVSVAATCGGF